MKSFKGHLNPRKKPDPKARKLLYQMFQSQSFSKTTVQDFTWADRQIHTRPSDNTKHATGHGTTLQRDKIQLHHQKTGTNPPVRIPSHDSGPTSLMEVDSTIRRNSNCPACRKETPDTEIWIDLKDSETCCRWRNAVKSCKTKQMRRKQATYLQKNSL